MRVKVGYRGEQVRQGSAHPIQLPDNQAVTGPKEGKRLGQPDTITSAAADPILEQVALVDAGREERVPLEIENLAVAVGGDTHIADQHVRKTSSRRFPHGASSRQDLSCSFLDPNGRAQAPLRA